MIRCIFIILITLFVSPLYGQLNMWALLDSIALNNMQIKASGFARDAGIANAHTGLNPPDPQVEYGYFPGNKDEIGTKTTLSITQSFHLPFVYARQTYASRLKGHKYASEYESAKLEVLFDAASVYIELVYLGNYVQELEKRAADAADVYEMAKKSLAAGEANQIESNKAQIEALKWGNELNLYNAKKIEKEQYLNTLNNGKIFEFSDIGYPDLSLPPLDTVIQHTIDSDPLLRTMVSELQIAVNHVKLQKALWLPQLSAGYEEEVILGDAYRGVQAGISFPLWQNRNTVKYARLQHQAIESNLAAYRDKLKSDVISEYQTAEAMKKNYEAYKNAAESINSLQLLKKSLETGNISVPEYYRELVSWYDMMDSYYASQRDYYISLIRILRFDF